METRLRIAVLVFGGAVLTACGGSKPGVGESCSAGDSYCTGNTEYFCDMNNGGTIRVIPCKGSGGCSVAQVAAGGVTQCDTSGNVAGDACKGDESFCADSHTKLVCDPVSLVLKPTSCSTSCFLSGGQAFCM